MNGPSNGSFDHLIGQLDRRLARIEDTLDRIENHNNDRHEALNGRIRELENSKSEAKGGWTVLTLVGTVAGAVGGYAAKWFS